MEQYQRCAGGGNLSIVDCNDARIESVFSDFRLHSIPSSVDIERPNGAADELLYQSLLRKPFKNKREPAILEPSQHYIPRRCNPGCATH